MVMDRIADMLVRIKNAGMAKRPSVCVPYSRVLFEIAAVLKEEGYVSDVVVKGKKTRKEMVISLRYENGAHAVSDVKRISKPSRRVYVGVRDITPVRHGHGIAVLSTPKGIMVGERAVREHVGGELLFHLW